MSHLVFFEHNKDIYLEKVTDFNSFDTWKNISFSFGNWSTKLNISPFEKEYYINNHDLYIIRNRNAFSFENQIIGVFSIFNVNSYYYLWNLGISNNYQHKGYGKTILEFIRERYKDIIFTIENNDMIKFYEKVFKKLYHINLGNNYHDRIYSTIKKSEYNENDLIKIVHDSSDIVNNCCGI